VENIKKMIEEDIKRKKRQKGRYLYYKKSKGGASGEFDIVDRDNKVRTIHTKKQSEIYINYLRMLVDQKIDYLFAKDVTIETNDYLESYEITDMLQQMSFNASLDARAWLHFYVNRKLQLDWEYVLDCEIIPIYDAHGKELVEVIRYYKLEEDKIRVERWDIKGMTTMVFNKEFDLESKFTKPHYEEISYFQDGEIQNIEPKSLPFLPFIPLYNNRACESDADGIEDLLFLYASIASGVVDNIDKFQEAITKLKGFSSDPLALKEAMDNIRRYKAVGIPEGGDIDLMKIEIPIEARAFILDLIKNAVFLIGKGMNPQQKGDGNITNVVLISRYSELDTKASNHERQVKKFYKQFIDCINSYYQSNLQNGIILNRNMIVNLTEKINNAIASKKLVSLRTAISMHPDVSDVDEELALINADKTVSKNEEDKKDE
jgi:SPP1 family phage portal protein